jgi:hypothetical protein
MHWGRKCALPSDQQQSQPGGKCFLTTHTNAASLERPVINKALVGAADTILVSTPLPFTPEKRECHPMDLGRAD